MRIQLIIPILNPEASFFSDIVPRLQSQTLHPNILLINSGDSILTGEYEVITINKKEFNHANTSNMAMDYEADFYLFMTQDAQPYDEKLIDKLADMFADPDVVVAYARQIPHEGADVIEVFARTTNYPEYSMVKSKSDLASMGIKTFFSSDSCAMYRGDYFRSIGGFTPGLNTNEDMEFAARAIMNGKKVAYMSDAKVYHSHNFTCKDIWKRYPCHRSIFCSK